MGTRLNRIYQNMKARCFNKKHKHFKDYGGRGITVCSEWLTPKKGWFLFRDWAISNGYSDNLTIDRIDNSKGYSPDNCRWVTIKDQQNNRRSNHFVTYKGRVQTLKQWCEELGLNYNKICLRISQRHWPIEKAFETRENASFHFITYKGKTQSLVNWCKELKLNYNRVAKRLEDGWSVNSAFEKREDSRKRFIDYQGKKQSLKDWCRELNLNYYKVAKRLEDLKWTVERAFETK